jgi:hypothetical protein
MPISFRSSSRSPFPRPNEAEIKQNRKEHSLDDGTHAADLGRLNEARAQNRHRNADPVKVKKELPRSQRTRLRCDETRYVYLFEIQLIVNYPFPKGAGCARGDRHQIVTMVLLEFDKLQRAVRSRRGEDAPERGQYRSLARLAASE